MQSRSKITALIVDDEAPAREILSGLLQRFVEGVEVVGEAANIVDAAKHIRQKAPDVLFLDIEMPQGNGFDLLEMVDTTGISIIFTTAYNQYAIRAIKFSALDYLLKPISPSELREAMDRVSKLKAKAISPEQRTELQQILNGEKQSPDRISIPVSDGLQVIHLKDIVRLQADVNYTRFFFESGDHLIVSRTLKEYSDMLETAGFCRIHQSHLINLTFVKKFIKGRNSEVEMVDGHLLPVSRDRKKDFLEKLNGTL